MIAAGPSSRGHLNPGDPAVVFDRFELAPGLADLVRHVWVVRWAIAPGETRMQRVLAYPAVNAVLMPSGAGLYGPDPRLQRRELDGESWAVGILFRPAAAPLLTTTCLEELLGCGEPLPRAPLGDVTALMTRAAGVDRGALTSVLNRWLLPLSARVDETGLLLNEVCRLAEEDRDIVRAAQLAERLGLKARTLERMVKDRIGVTPKWLIECRRLQEAATTLFEDPEIDVTALALELGYADYAHFSRRYKRVLDETPQQTRRQAAARR